MRGEDAHFGAAHETARTVARSRDESDLEDALRGGPCGLLRMPDRNEGDSAS